MLTGNFPYGGDSLQEVYNNIRTSNGIFNQEQIKRISPEARKFV